ncbi:NADPH-dependent glutamate synthase [Porphyromonas levii]|uniref:NADPH-dependent glutamate synthase n=1 Tax=Porphyromonas levii TaxID=28114 RepID=UPI002012E9E6|nr:NADPH-dependent glutamate synthase [Porphyromonas levii]MBR8763222.1 Glutamate synthase [NADPH] small chain [Porphyromonas levii]MBR8785492.1 Glutamate synthase [NADPH] small chain [Porphyromonas levii]MBR8803240.1 Glutamate synthase [NADPH] small chain [Porphyromonas levii]
MDLIKERRAQEWREELRKATSPKERMAMTRVEMPALDGKYRATNHEEVSQGLTDEMARSEAKRCLDCVNPSCMEGCPVSIHIPSFIKNVEAGNIMDAAKVIRETSSLPGVCGRVCPQEKQCESKCIYTQKMNKPAVAIGFLERYVSDYERKAILSGVVKEDTEEIVPNGIKVAIAGAGPAGLSCAGDLAKWGYDVTVFDALHELGGVLRYGIPEFRLPNDIVDFEIDRLKALGIKFETNVIVGKTISYEDLHEEGFKAIFVASGAGLPRFMHIPGENLVGVMSSNEYLTRVNLMKAGQPGADTPVSHGKNVAVIGGGNTAMDSVRTALRLGAKRAIIVYRRSEDEMPARLEEVHHAKEEGVEFMTLHNPIEYVDDGTGKVRAMRVQKMELGEPDASGRRSPVPVEGAIEEIEVDQVVVSVGVSPNPIIPTNFKGLKITKKGTIEVKAETNQSDLEDVFAGGDIVRGGATVILAMGDGRKAAAGIHEYLQSNK